MVPWRTAPQTRCLDFASPPEYTGQIRTPFLKHR